ncbi:hypothetical protein H0Z60_02105 [Ectothiorhodospiraceae bacterium WFHF3C12]|nr:hypothetical protein [Ectothiorhodospiraceae bacterium WFHF3C12]
MRKQTWRLDLDAYPFKCELQSRYTDLDTWRHVNNVAVQQLHLEARMRHHLSLFGETAWYADGVRLRPLQVNTHFLRVTGYPESVIAGVRVVDVGAERYRLAVGLFQAGACVGVQDCLIGGWSGKAATDVPPGILESMAGQQQPVADLPEIELTDAPAEDLGTFPLHGDLTARYGDLDADSGVGEVSVARFMEQGRSTLVRDLKLGDRGLVVASVDIRHLNYQPIGGPVDLPIGVSRVGRSSFVLRTAAVRRERVLAVADSVMVLTDRDTGRPATMTDEFRRGLTEFCLPSAEMV